MARQTTHAVRQLLVARSGHAERACGSARLLMCLLVLVAALAAGCKDSSKQVTAPGTNTAPASQTVQAPPPQPPPEPPKPPRKEKEEEIVWQTYSDITRLFAIRYPADWVVRQQAVDSGFEVVFTPVRDASIRSEDLTCAAKIVVFFSPFGNVDSYLPPEDVFARQRPIYEALNRKYQVRFEGQDLIKLPGVQQTNLVRGLFMAQSGGQAYREEYIRIPRPRWTLVLVCDYPPKDLAVSKRMQGIQDSLVLPSNVCDWPVEASEPASPPPDLMKRVRDCTVLIVVKDAQGKPVASGSGFLVHQAGYIMSNAHVVAPDEEEDKNPDAKRRYEVHWDQRVGKAPVPAEHVSHARDDRHGVDFGLLHVDGVDWPTLGVESTARMDNLSEVIAPGFPKPDVAMDKFDITIQKGVINRVNHAAAGHVLSLFTDLHFDHGNSGGPCLSARSGRVVGVNSFVKQGDLAMYGGVLPMETAFEHFPQLYYPPAGSRDVTVHDHYKLACMFWGLGRPLAAVRELAHASQMDNSNPHVWHLWGMVWEMAGEPGKAGENYEKALRIDPKASSARVRLAVMQLAREKLDYPKASELVEAVIQADPEGWGGYALRGQLYRKNKQLEKAQADFQKAVQLAHDLFPDPHIDLARAILDQASAGATNQAQAAVEKALLIDPIHREGLLLLAQLNSGQTASSLERFTGLAKRYPEDPTAQWLLARAMGAKGDDAEGAAKRYAAALKLFLKRELTIPDDFYNEAGQYGLAHNLSLALQAYEAMYEQAPSADVKQNVQAMVGLSQVMLRTEGKGDLGAGLQRMADDKDSGHAWRCRSRIPDYRSYDSSLKLKDDSVAFALQRWGPVLALGLMTRMEWDFEAKDARTTSAWLAQRDASPETFFKLATLLKLAHEVTRLQPFQFGDDKAKSGYIATVGGLARLIVEPQFESAYSFSGDTAQVKLDGKWGWINRSGKYVIEPRFEEASDFSDGLARVKQNGKYGWIDETGKFVIEPRFDSAWWFGSDGVAQVSLNGKISFVDRSGKLLFEPRFDEISSLNDTNWWVKSNGRWGVASRRSGDYVIEPMFDAVHYFSDGLGGVQQSGRWGFIDSAFKMAIEPRFEDISSFDNGLARVKQDGKWGWIDRSGKLVIEAKYESANAFYKGEAYVKSNGKWGLIDQSGREILRPVFEEINSFDSGLAWAKQNGKWGKIDRSGGWVVEAKYDDYSGYGDAEVAVKQNGKWGFLDKDGRTVRVEPQFDAVGSFDRSRGLMKVQASSRWGLFSPQSGKYLNDQRFDEVRDLSDNLAAVRVNNRWGYIDKDGKMAIETRFIGITDFRDGIAAIRVESGKCGHIDRSGTILFGDRYDQAWTFAAGVGRVELNSKLYFIDKKGGILWPKTQ